MASKVMKKKFLRTNVYDAAIERINKLYDMFDEVVVSFSGGKDSTTCLNLCLEVARKRKRLPLRAHFWDEEALYPDTIEYVLRLRENPELEIKWLCLPIKHRNACSRRELWWYPWDPEKKHLWVRQPPEGAIMSLKGFFHGMTMPDAAHLPYGPEYGTVADVRGLRADESLRRYRVVMSKVEDNWLGGQRSVPNFDPKIKVKNLLIRHSYTASPIYDWTTIDVWFAPKLFGWDYNRAYDLLDKAGIPPHWQRCCPPFGEEPLKSLWTYQACYPDIWDKMVNRVHGAATAARYSNTELYATGSMALPRGHTWQSYAMSLLELYPVEYKKIIAGNMASVIELHKSKTKRPLSDAKPDPATGLSWKYLAMLIHRADLKDRRAGSASSKAAAERAKSGESIEDVMSDGSDSGTRY